MGHIGEADEVVPNGAKACQDLGEGSNDKVLAMAETEEILSVIQQNKPTALVNFNHRLNILPKKVCLIYASTQGQSKISCNKG